MTRMDEDTGITSVTASDAAPDRHRQARRLRMARRNAGYRTVMEAAARNRWNSRLYRDHEQGKRSYGADEARIYADAYGIDVSKLDDDGPGEPLPPTIGEILCVIRERSGVSLEKLARGGGWRGASCLQRYFNVKYDPDHLPEDVARRLVEGMDPHGASADLKHDLNALSRPADPTPSAPGLRSMAVARSGVQPLADTLDLTRLRPCDRLAMLTLYDSLIGMSERT